MAKKVEITVPRKGIANGTSSIVIETDGFTGEECRTATQAFALLGNDVEEEPKQELYETDDNQQWLQEGE